LAAVWRSGNTLVLINVYWAALAGKCGFLWFSFRLKSRFNACF